jgi:hypothetical protein
MQTARYRDPEFRKFIGFEANYFEVESLDEYWISGCRKDGADRLYGEHSPVEIEEDVGDEYWTVIRDEPNRKLEPIANRQRSCDIAEY